MRAVVVGAGVVGVATAWTLHQAGFEVVVVEAGSVGTGATAVNAGLLVPGDSVVWPSPESPLLLARSVLGRDKSGIIVRAGAGLSLIPWGLHFLAQCTPRRYARNVAAAHALSTYSYNKLEALSAQLTLDYAHQRNGMAFLFADAEQRRAGLEARGALAMRGETYQELTGAQLAELDPGFMLAGQVYDNALYTDRCGHGDCLAFTLGLAEHARNVGVRFLLNQQVTALRTSGKAVTGLHTASGLVDGDVFVLACGWRSAQLARTAGLRIPILPARGYAVTVPIVDSDRVPWVGGVAEDVHVAFSRTATHMRISSSAEFVGHVSPPRAGAYNTIRAVGGALFGTALNWDSVAQHVGYRPMTPTSLPFIGSTPLANLFLNTGHSHLGWTQAVGSAHILADLVTERTPEIATAPYEPRFAGGVGARSDAGQPGWRRRVTAHDRDVATSIDQKDRNSS